MSSFFQLSISFGLTRSVFHIGLCLKAQCEKYFLIISTLSGWYVWEMLLKLYLEIICHLRARIRHI